MIIHLSRRLEMETLEIRYKHQPQQRALVILPIFAKLYK